MSNKYLGNHFDIHGGGMDLVFPHHEAEIAQSNACHNCDPAKYWMHNNMITINGVKMGKSLGNFINLHQFFNGDHEMLDRAYQPMTIRFFMLQAHYRSQIDFSNQALVSAEKGMEKLLNAHATIDTLKADQISEFNFDELKEKCYDAINDDLNTPILISHLFEGVKVINSCKAGKLKLDQKSIDQSKELFDLFILDILGIKAPKNNKANDISDDVMQIVLELRAKAKEEKDWSTADLIRDQLKKLNIEVKDGSETSSWEIKEN